MVRGNRRFGLVMAVFGAATVLLFIACSLPGDPGGTTTTTATTLPPPSPGTDLVAYYPLDGDANDASGKGNHAHQGKLSYGANRQGSAGRAAYFNPDTGDFLRVPHSADFDFGTGDFTVSFWFYARHDSIQPLVNCFTNGDWAWDIRYDGTLKVYLDGSEPPIITDTGLIPGIDSWHHVALRREGGWADLFVDGVKNSLGASNTNIVSGSTLNFGIFPDYPGYETLDGMLDEVRIHKRALSNAEILQQAQAAGEGPQAENLTAGLLAFYTMDYTSELPSNSYGTGPDFAIGGAISMADRRAIADGAMDFDDKYCMSTESTTAFDFQTGDFSISLWFYSREYTDAPLANQYPDAWDLRLGWGNGLPDRLYVFCGGETGDEGGDTGNLKVASGVVSLNAWHHVLFRRKDGIVDCFLDGNQWIVGYSSDNLASGDPLNLSMFPGFGLYLNGGLDDLRIYGRALNAAELFSLLHD